MGLSILGHTRTVLEGTCHLVSVSMAMHASNVHALQPQTERKPIHRPTFAASTVASTPSPTPDLGPAVLSVPLTCTSASTPPPRSSLRISSMHDASQSPVDEPMTFSQSRLPELPSFVDGPAAPFQHTEVESASTAIEHRVGRLPLRKPVYKVDETIHDTFQSVRAPAALWRVRTGLATGLGLGAATEAIRRATSASPEDEGSHSVFMSEANIRRLVDKLSRMRGAALKLGQFMSIQGGWVTAFGICLMLSELPDSRLLPAQVDDIMLQLQNSANYMPQWQTERVLETTLGREWRAHFDDFDMVPFAAASIGQVHAAVISPTSPFASQYPHGLRLAVKVQFPGVRESISSDLSSLKWLLVASAVLPKGLYLENTLKVMKRELDDECDYAREADCGMRMRELVATSSLAASFACPRVVKELCGNMVLTTEMMVGEPLGLAIDYDQVTRDESRFTDW
ncbi:hypothetical protein P7C70_g5958, partial [Phenoliferia sp. Uapishka_3]